MGFVKPNTLLYYSGAYGGLGVAAFFVISGFVIPLSLERSGYRVSSFGRFLLRRFVRLDPPYLVAIAASLALAGYYARVTHTPLAFSTTQILLHIGYLNVFFSYPWINPVFWTLAVEVQYYILMGLAFPSLKKPKLFWLVLAPGCVALAVMIPASGYIFRYFPLFLYGIAAFHRQEGVLGTRSFLLIIFCVCCSAVIALGLASAVAGLVTVLCIAFVRFAPRALSRLGAISYSLYLIHGPIGFTIASVLVRRI